jgi:hypothetical protein
MPDNQGDNTPGPISNGIGAGAGLTSIASAALGTAGWRNR